MPTELSLDDAVRAATHASPEIRIDYRDPIAKHGAAAIDRVAPWLSDPRLAAFAIRVIARAGELGSQDHARRTLQANLVAIAEPALSDARSALVKLGGRPRSEAAHASTDALSAVGLDELAIGEIYARSALHSQGLGGNRQKGISYPAKGSYVLLFSDPRSVDEWGYRDGPKGLTGYTYYGEWSGTGDMLPTGGNAAIIDRSPEIYLFVKAPPGHRFLGRFACIRVEHRLATRDGHEHKAIVFELERVVTDGQR